MDLTSQGKNTPALKILFINNLLGHFGQFRLKTMNILITCNNFSYLSGSPLYVYTLGKELVNMGNQVTIYSGQIGGVITDKAEYAGIKVINTLDSTKKYDVIHLNQNWSKHVLDVYDSPAIYTIHSEFACETPIRDSRIKKYIAIRPSIAEKWGIDCEIIYNPIDFSRFHPFQKPKDELTLFVGTIDNLRMKSALHLLEENNKVGKKTRFVGQKFASWADRLSNYFPETWYVEEHLKDATETAGIMLGRTTLEGYACGIPAIIYDVDEVGNIKSITRHEPPEDMSPFDSKLVAKQIEKIYDEVSKM